MINSRLPSTLHRSPINPAAQLHLNEPPSFKQVPPLKQGELAQGEPNNKRMDKKDILNG